MVGFNGQEVIAPKTWFGPDNAPDTKIFILTIGGSLSDCRLSIHWNREVS